MRSLKDKSHLYADTGKPVLKTPLPASELIGLLRQAVEKRYPEDARAASKVERQWKKYRFAVNKFERFLAEQAIQTVSLDEQLLDDFVTHLVKKYIQKRKSKPAKQSPERHYQKDACDIRTLVNDLPPEVLSRPLMNHQALKSIRRVGRFVPQTKDILLNFLADGRKVKKEPNEPPQLSTETYSAVYRESIFDITMRFLDAIGKTNLLDVTQEDAERFINLYKKRANGKTPEENINAAIGSLVTVRPVFENMVAQGLMPTNPLKSYTHKLTSDAGTFCMPEDVDRLLDLSTVDWKKFKNVRDRTIALMYYDFGVRKGELALLDISDLAEAPDCFKLHLRPEVQKGQHKEASDHFSLFDPTRIALKRYLAMRRALAGDDAALFVSSVTGRRLMPTGCRDATVNHCNKLGMAVTGANGENGKNGRKEASSEKKKRVTPHALRRSLGTINISPIGLCLTPEFLQDRLRHESMETVLRHYILKNPLLKKMKRDAFVNKNAPQVASAGRAQAQENSSDLIVPEYEAVQGIRAKQYRISPDSLRQHCLRHGQAEHRNGAYFYSDSFIRHITEQCVSKRTVMQHRRLTRSGFWAWSRSRGLKPLVIGKERLVTLADTMK